MKSYFLAVAIWMVFGLTWGFVGGLWFTVYLHHKKDERTQADIRYFLAWKDLSGGGVKEARAEDVVECDEFSLRLTAAGDGSISYYVKKGNGRWRSEWKWLKYFRLRDQGCYGVLELPDSTGYVLVEAHGGHVWYKYMPPNKWADY